MDRPYHVVRDADFICLAFTAGLVFYIGIRASASHPTVEKLAAWVSGLIFLTYIATAISVDGYEPLEWIASYVFRGGFVAAIVLGTLCFVGSFAARTWQIIAPIPRRLRDRRAAARRRAEAEARPLEDAEEHLRREQQFIRDREEAKRLAEEEQKLRNETACRQAAEQQRRMDARAECELCYSKHLNELANRFPKPVFNAFMQTYMNDHQPAEAVERRGKELQRIVQEHAAEVKPAKKSNSMHELAGWFLQEKERIESLPIDTEIRDCHLVQLNIRYAELTQNMLEKVQP
jgi:hypothetical protein